MASEETLDFWWLCNSIYYSFRLVPHRLSRESNYISTQRQILKRHCPERPPPMDFVHVSTLSHRIQYLFKSSSVAAIFLSQLVLGGWYEYEHGAEMKLYERALFYLYSFC